jgi:hypothetical protein
MDPTHSPWRQPTIEETLARIRREILADFKIGCYRFIVMDQGGVYWNNNDPERKNVIRSAYGSYGGIAMRNATDHMPEKFYLCFDEDVLGLATPEDWQQYFHWFGQNNWYLTFVSRILKRHGLLAMYKYLEIQGNHLKPTHDWTLDRERYFTLVQGECKKKKGVALPQDILLHVRKFLLFY